MKQRYPITNLEIIKNKINKKQRTKNDYILQYLTHV